MFISFEGTEGVGKTTLIKGLTNYLNDQNIDFITTREPGGSPLAENIRQLLLTPNANEQMASDCELLLMFAARSQHLAQTIQPALSKKQWVLCDRFVDATFAYQCGGRGIPEQKIQHLVDNFVPVMPTLTFWLDADVNIGLKRATKRAELDRFEQEKTEFFNLVRGVYAARALAEPNRIVRLDATLSPDEIIESALKVLTPYIFLNP